MALPTQSFPQAEELPRSGSSANYLRMIFVTLVIIAVVVSAIGLKVFLTPKEGASTQRQNEAVYTREDAIKAIDDGLIAFLRSEGIPGWSYKTTIDEDNIRYQFVTKEEFFKVAVKNGSRKSVLNELVETAKPKSFYVVHVPFTYTDQFGHLSNREKTFTDFIVTTENGDLIDGITHYKKK